MNYSLNDLEPSLLWKHFSTICSIPHPSKHEQKLAEWIISFARQQKLDCIQDSAGNLLIRKPATRGKEHSDIIILQSHLDMVPQKHDSTNHDFFTDPICPYSDGEWVRAEGTTLGADNGIGAAASLAILEDTALVHGPLEVLFTIDEETGMSGVKNLDPNILNGKRLINLDTEDEKELCVGCAGGIDVIATCKPVCEAVTGEKLAFRISIDGLRGGHSGIDIHTGRGNAIKLLNRILFIASEKFNIGISSFNGGNIRNAIPRLASAEFVIPAAFEYLLYEWLREMEKIIKSEHTPIEPEIQITLTKIPPPEHSLSRALQTNLLQALYACPNGVYKMSNALPDLVETSNNISILNCNADSIKIECLCRSSTESSREDCGNAILSALSLGGMHVEFCSGYPGWTPDPSSKLLSCMEAVYKNVYKKDPAIVAVHAGLECGLIGAKYPGMEMVSCGPTICNPHSPEERVSIESVKNFWNYLTTLLQKC
ncbi:MAG: aminoacyl-histidine dipeptidase [Chitinispirillaceae bacterium]|nr:aminoacyl-histidine dipeptidase [Chitinispirillaceae bacterium]